MFPSSKDLKLGPKRRGQGSGSGPARDGDGRDDVVEKARRERAQREKLRACRAQVVLIQRWYRGRCAAASARAKERADWDRKMSDFSKLQRTLVSRGIPFVPPISFVLPALQQLLYFYRSPQDSDRLCLSCESVLSHCIVHPDVALSAGAHLVGAGGGIVDGKVVASREALVATLPALRLRLRRFLAICVDHVEREFKKGVTDGNSPLKILLLLVGGEGLAAHPPAVVEILSLVSRASLEILVFELNLFSVARNVLLGNQAERSAVAAAGGGGAVMKLLPERQRAIHGSWKLALAAVDAAGTLLPPDAKKTFDAPPRGRLPLPPLKASVSVDVAAADVAAADAAAETLHATFVAQVLSVPLLPSRLGADGVDLLLKERPGAFVNCLEDFRAKLEASRGGDPSGKEAFYFPPSSVSCCSTETFLLGNVVAVGTKLPLESGGDVTRGLRVFMQTVTSLLELKAIPDSLLTDRQAITWQTQEGAGLRGGGGTSMTALAVPQAVQDQVRLLVSDRWIRAASKRALEGVNDGLLRLCSERDRRENEEILELSAASLAIASVQKYREEASRGIVSKWAEKLLNHGMRLFGASASLNAASGGSSSGLIDSSAASRAAAMGNAAGAGGPGNAIGGEEEEKVALSKAGDEAAKGSGNLIEKPHDYDAGSVLALSELLGVLLRRWCSGVNASNQVLQGVMSTLCFSFPCVARLWAFIINECSSFESLCASAPIKSATGGGLYTTIAVMCCLFGHLLVVLDDADLYENGRPLPLHHIRTLVMGLKGPLFVFCWEYQEDNEVSRGACSEHFGSFFAGAAERLLRELYARGSRRALCRSQAWVVPEAESNRMLSEIKMLSTRSKRLLRAMPFCMSLTRRMRVFDHLVKADKVRYQPGNTPGVPLRVRRGHVLEDGLAALGPGGRAGKSIKRRLRVVYTSALGYEESGIDAGGLFKDFWTDLSSLLFDVNFGLFKMTKEGLMYPNPSSGVVHGRDNLDLFEFVGRVLGKALYEGITVQPEFATFFLGFIRGDYNFLNVFHDLNGLDPELYRNLMFLKNYSGSDVEDLCLTFMVADEVFGANKEVELVPGGSRRAVTSANRLEYVNRVAKHHLVDGVRDQAKAFVKGMWEVIDPQWLQMFSEPELQVLISGSNKTVDVEDLRRHTRYSGGFVRMDRTVRRFWSVLNSMNGKERAALLRFVTSCERPPPLGFESMQPPFCLHCVGVRSDEERLPTASTCFNTLKLPTYSSEKVMKAKLLTSIFSGTGFELS